MTYQIRTFAVGCLRATRFNNDARKIILSGFSVAVASLHTRRRDIAKPLEDLSGDLKVETVPRKMGPKSHRSSDRAFIVVVCRNNSPLDTRVPFALGRPPLGVDVRQVSQKEMDFTPRYGSHIHLSAVPPVIVRVHHIVIVWWCVVLVSEVSPC